jgi:hypothetical protein
LLSRSQSLPIFFDVFRRFNLSDSRDSPGSFFQ